MGGFGHEFSAAEAWAALETLHGLPLTPHDASAACVEHVGEEVTLILVERVDGALVARLRDLNAARTPAFVYAWAPGQVTNAAGPMDLEVKSVRETLVSRFRG